MASISVDTSGLDQGDPDNASSLTIPLTDLKEAIEAILDGTAEYDELASNPTYSGAGWQIFFKDDGLYYQDGSQTYGPVSYTGVSAPAATWVELAAQSEVTGSPQTDIEFTSISQAYKDLRIVGSLAQDSSGNKVSSITLTFNNNTTDDYNLAVMYSADFSASSQALVEASSSGVRIDIPDSANNGDDWQFAIFELVIYGYAETSKYKTAVLDCIFYTSGSSSPVSRNTQHGTILLENTAAISSIKLAGTFQVGTTYGLYGRS